jgi:hypothetical protein
VEFGNEAHTRRVVQPERPAPRDLDNTPDHQGIEIDHERERPQGDDKLQ